MLLVFSTVTSLLLLNEKPTLAPEKVWRSSQVQIAAPPPPPYYLLNQASVGFFVCVCVRTRARIKAPPETDAC